MPANVPHEQQEKQLNKVAHITQPIGPSAHNVSAGTQAVELAPTQLSALSYHWGNTTNYYNDCCRADWQSAGYSQGLMLQRHGNAGSLDVSAKEAQPQRPLRAVPNTSHALATGAITHRGCGLSASMSSPYSQAALCCAATAPPQHIQHRSWRQPPLSPRLARRCWSWQRQKPQQRSHSMLQCHCQCLPCCLAVLPAAAQHTEGPTGADPAARGARGHHVLPEHTSRCPHEQTYKQGPQHGADERSVNCQYLHD